MANSPFCPTDFIYIEKQNVGLLLFRKRIFSTIITNEPSKLTDSSEAGPTLYGIFI